MTGLAIGSIKARDEISEVGVVIAFRTRLLDTFVLVVQVGLSGVAGCYSNPGGILKKLDFGFFRVFFL